MKRGLALVLAKFTDIPKTTEDEILVALKVFGVCKAQTDAKHDDWIEFFSLDHGQPYGYSQRRRYSVAVLDVPDTPSLLKALYAGAHDIIHAPFEYSNTVGVVERQKIWAEGRRAHIRTRTLADFEQEAISYMLRACDGQISSSARKLGIGRSTLYRKMELYGITADQSN
jgi:DNA-binding NtrC family response regulator